MAQDGPAWTDLVGMGTVAAAIFVVGLVAGWMCDLVFHTFPVLIFVGLALGIAGASRYMYVEFRKHMND